MPSLALIKRIRGEARTKKIRGLRLYAWKRQHGRCYYCFDPITKSDCTADHKVPRSKGGEDTHENVVAACNECNMLKKNHPVEQFLKRKDVRKRRKANSV